MAGGSRRGVSTRTYRASGVDLSSRARAVRGLLASARYRAPVAHGQPIAGAAGHYAGLIRVGSETVAITTDTVGTKVLLAEALGRWEEVGEDMVAVNVNDLASVGARTAGLVDTILYGSASAATFRALGRGLRRGLARAECSLLGGETAAVPEMVQGIDLGGTAIGFFPDGRRPVLGDRIRSGDVVLGIPSFGFHANGYTLVRRVLRERRVGLTRPRPGGSVPLGRELLRPSRTYTRASEAVADREGVHGLAHVSGGGLRNFLRLNGRVRFVLDQFPAAPGLFRWFQRLGGIEDAEMYQTFNMGIGFAIVLAPSAREEAERRLRRAGFRDVQEIGHIEAGTGVELPALGIAYTEYA